MLYLPMFNLVNNLLNNVIIGIAKVEEVSGIDTLKCLGIYLQLSSILELKPFGKSY